jgi:hypothetical protein
MDLIASKIAKGILNVQRYWADSMSKLASRASIKTQWVIFILFVAVSVGNCSWLIYRSFNHHPTSNSRKKTDRPILIKPRIPSDTTQQNNGSNSPRKDTLHH